MPAPIDQQLVNSLIELELIKKEQLDKAIAEAKSSNTDLGVYLVENDFISDENLGKLIADLLKFPLIRLANVNIPPNIISIVPAEFAEKFKIIPFKRDQGKLLVATTNPNNKEVMDNLSKKSGLPVEVYYATELDIKENLHLFKKKLETVYKDLTVSNKGAKLGKILDDNLPIDKIVITLVEYAYDNRASDIHIEPRDQHSVIRFRIDGTLHDMLTIPKTTHDQIINKIKVDSKLRTDEHMSSQDGKMQEKVKEEEIDIRISIMPVVGGENCVLRLLTSTSHQYGLQDLGMSEKDFKKVTNGFTKPYGMILSTGPTGSGKTTSMYSILKILNTREVNIATIEDPVEYTIEGITQIQVNNKTNLSFAAGLRSILRQDPNIIYVGEIRDSETAGIAINSAMTGHLVLSTLHTNDAATALPRLIDMDIEPFLIASTVNVIVAQRLVRKICDSCKVSYSITPAEITKKYGLTLSKTTDTLYMGKGCPVCNNTGYADRIGIFEILEITDAIRKLITQKATADEIAQQAVKEGMTTMLKDGIGKAVMGITTLDEILRATRG